MAFLDHIGLSHLRDLIFKKLETKVDKVNGKGLSTNDYTTEEKEKLSSIQSGAEANVQSDWSQNDDTMLDFIKNRPFGEVLTASDTLTWDGNTDELACIADLLYKVSNVVLTREQLQAATITVFMEDNGVDPAQEYTIPSSRLKLYDEGTGVIYMYESLLHRCDVVFVVGEGADISQFPEPGIYFAKRTKNAVHPFYICSITIPGVGCFTTETVTKLDAKYLPDEAMAQSDWNQTDEAAADFIKNKPDVSDVVRYSTQSLDYSQKLTARRNIGAAEEYHTHPYLAFETMNLALPWSGSYGRNVIGYGDGKFVAVYDNPAYSTDGISWTQNDDWLSTDSWGGIAYGNGVFVVVPSAYQDRQAWYYHDGRWDSSYMHTDDESSNDSYCDWTSVAYGNGKFIAVGNNSSSGYGCMAWSADGSEWTRLSGDVIEQNVWTHVVYGNGTFMAFGSNNMDIYCSTDGINWTQGGTPSSMSSSMLLAYAKDKFFLIDGYRINYSTDGQMWTTVDLGDSYSIEQVVYGNNKFVALLYDSRVMISEDGTSWELRELPIFEYSYGDSYITFGNGKFVAANGEGYIAVSTDGVNWTKEGTALNQDGVYVTEAVKELLVSGLDVEVESLSNSEIDEVCGAAIISGEEAKL